MRTNLIKSRCYPLFRLASSKSLTFCPNKKAKNRGDAGAGPPSLKDNFLPSIGAFNEVNFPNSAFISALSTSHSAPLLTAADRTARILNGRPDALPFLATEISVLRALSVGYGVAYDACDPALLIVLRDFTFLLNVQRSRMSFFTRARVSFV